MNTANKTTRILGVAFLFQFVTSFTGGVSLKPAWFVEGDIGATMLKIAQNPLLMRATILLDMLTALGVAFLGVVLYLTLRKQGEKAALTALVFYILEGAVLAASKLETFSILRFSQEYVVAGQPAELLRLAQIAAESMDFVGGTLHMLAFCAGAIPFYFLLYRSGVVPRWLSLWGLITVFPLLVGTLTQIFGYNIPFGFYVPYVPFELVIGLWLVIKGLPESTS
ncbi:MAG TPA: DUF4386 domain-containing protein [Anaerolineae bacterium]|nr:DUF4386 domain-containing protein [Anaerolineae bacterium]